MHSCGLGPLRCPDCILVAGCAPGAVWTARAFGGLQARPPRPPSPRLTQASCGVGFSGARSNSFPGRVSHIVNPHSVVRWGCVGVRDSTPVAVEVTTQKMSMTRTGTRILSLVRPAFDCLKIDQRHVARGFSDMKFVKTGTCTVAPLLAPWCTAHLATQLNIESISGAPACWFSLRTHSGTTRGEYFRRPDVSSVASSQSRRSAAASAARAILSSAALQ